MCGAGAKLARNRKFELLEHQTINLCANRASDRLKLQLIVISWLFVASTIAVVLFVRAQLTVVCCTKAMAQLGLIGAKPTSARLNCYNHQLILYPGKL